MTEDPRYLRNQSRAIHRLHRSNRRMMRWCLALWLLAVAAFTGAAGLDVIADLGWGYEARHVWIGLLMILCGCGFWVISTAISHVVLAISRRVYGPEPPGPVED